MKILKLLTLIICCFSLSKAAELDNWTITEYTLDEYPEMEYVELYNGNFHYIYIDTLSKREEQKSLISDLQKTELYSFIQKAPGILFYDLSNPDFSDEYEEKLKITHPEFLPSYKEQKEIFKKNLSEVKELLHGSNELFQELLITQKQFIDTIFTIDINYQDYEIMFYDLVGESILVEKIKNKFPIIFESFEKNGVTGLIRDFETGSFSIEGIKFFEALPKGIGEKTIDKIFRDFNTTISKVSKLHKTILAQNISYVDMFDLMKKHFELDKILLYHITH